MEKALTKACVAVVAVILIAVAGVALLNYSVTPGYDIGQTIEALKHTRTLHMLCRDWGGKEFEMWIRLIADGYPQYCYSYHPDSEVTNISTPEVSYQYDRKMNRVLVSKGRLYHFDIQFRKIFEDIQKAALKNENDVKVSRQAVSAGVKKLIVLMCKARAGGWEIFIDPETKLPLAFNCLRGRSRPGEFVRDFADMRFDEELPAGIFEFEMPAGAVVTDMDKLMGLLDDVNNGISAEGLTKQQAAEKIAHEFFKCIIAKDLEKAKKVYPSISLYVAQDVEKRWRKLFGDTWPGEFLEPGMLYLDNCGLGEILPCTLMFQDGLKREAKIIIRFRNTGGKLSCVIAGYFGYPVIIN